jgi:NADH-quinone oxidoreductase subunit A
MNVMADFLPILLFVLVAALVSCAMLAGPRLIAPRKRTAVKEMPYESGMDPIHDTRRRFAVRFHLVAIAFLVFDVELLFLYPWAVAVRHAETAGTDAQTGAVVQAVRGIDLAVSDGWISSRGLVFAGAMVFILLVVLGFVYDWRKGVFKWR